MKLISGKMCLRFLSCMKSQLKSKQGINYAEINKMKNLYRLLKSTRS